MRGGIRKHLNTHNSPQKGFAYLRSPHQMQKFNSVVNVQDNPQSRIRMKKTNAGVFCSLSQSMGLNVCVLQKLKHILSVISPFTF